MRHHDVGNVRHALRAFFVLGVDVVQEAELLRGLGGAQVGFVDDAGAGAVDQRGAFLHLAQQRLVDHALGFGRFGQMQGHVVRLGEQFVEGNQLDAQFRRLANGGARVEAQEGRLEARQALDDQAADVAQADDADRLARDLGAHEGGFFPRAGAAGGVGRDQLARVAQHQGHHFFGHAVGIRAGGVHHVHALGAGMGDVDRVVAGAGPHDHLQIGRRVDDFRRDLLAADDQRMQIGVFLGELQDVGLRNLRDRIAAVGFQDFLGDGIQRRRDQYLLHLFFLLLLFDLKGEL